MDIRMQGESRPTEYEKPVVVDYGDLIELTAGQSHGSVTDQTFQAGTAYGSLTFS